MSTNTENNSNMAKETKSASEQSALTTVKKSIWGELSATSATCIILLILLVAGSIALYIFMNIVPEKKILYQDDAAIFTEDEAETIEKLAEELMEKDDINVVVATTRLNPLGTSDSDCKEYAEQIYKENCISTSMRDNSGICIYIDLTIDKPGMRFFWIYTYGSAYYSVSDDDCNMLFNGQKKLLQEENYGEAVINIMKKLDEVEFHSTGLVVIYGCSILIPIILALIVTGVSTMKSNLDPVPSSSQYTVKNLCKTLENSDTFVR